MSVRLHGFPLHQALPGAISRWFHDAPCSVRGMMDADSAAPASSCGVWWYVSLPQSALYMQYRRPSVVMIPRSMREVVLRSSQSADGSGRKAELLSHFCCCAEVLFAKSFLFAFAVARQAVHSAGAAQDALRCTARPSSSCVPSG